MRTHTRKILRDVLSRKVRTLLVSASIFIGVLGVIALLSVRDIIIKRLGEDVKESELTMIDVDVSLKSNASPNNTEVLQLLNQENEAGQALNVLNGIERVEGQAYHIVKFRKPSDESFTEGELRAFSVPLQEVQLEPMRLVEGGVWPIPNRNEIALETRMAERYGVEIGDEIIFQTRDAELTYTIVGLVFHPYSYKRFSTTGALLPGPEDGIYAQFEDVATITGFEGFTRLVARYETFELAEDHFEEFQNIIIQETPYIPKFPILENPSDNGQVFNAETFGNILSLLALVALIVSGFLVVNVVNTIIAEQKRQIGILKSLGANTLDNFIIYGGIAVCYGVIGTLFAVIPGILVGYQLAIVLGPQLDVLIEEFAWSPQSVLFGIVMGIFVPILAAALPVYNGTRVSIINALTDLGISTDYGQGPIARTIGASRLPSTIRQAISNIIQKKGRLALTGLTLTMAIGATMGVFALGIALDKAVDDIFNRLTYQSTVLPTELENIESVKTVLEAQEGVVAAHPGVILSIYIDGPYQNFFTRNNQVIAFGIDPAARDYRFRYVDGTGWQNDPNREGVVVAAPMADQLGVKAGDELAFIVGGTRVTQEIIAIEDAAFDAVWIRWDRLAGLAGYSKDGPQPNQYAVLATRVGLSDFIGAVGINTDGARLLNGTTLAEDSVFITETLAGSELSLGDTFTVIIQGQPVERTIAGIISTQQVTALAGNPSLPTESIVFFDFNDLINLTGARSGTTPIPNGYYVVTNLENPTVEAVNELNSKIADSLQAAGINSEIQNQVAQFGEISDLIAQNVAILSLSAILIAAVGSIGLLTTLTITVFERQKEIGVMRSIGASSFTVAQQFLTEGILVGFLAWVFGIPISYGLALLLNAAFRLDTVKFRYPSEILILGLIGTLLIAALASLGPSIGAARKTVSEILRYQ